MRHKKVVQLIFIIICISIFVIGINKKNNSIKGLKMDRNIATKIDSDIVAKTDLVNSNNIVLNLNQKIFNYMDKNENRDSVMKTALFLNDGKYENDCVFFVSEVLRRLNVNLSKEVGNTYQLMYQLNKRSWKRYSSYKDLIPGDVCFTTNDNGGYPTHSFVFMKWEKKGSYEYAYVVDNQENRYGTIYHLRNVSITDVYKGTRKEAFAFFLRS